MFFAVAVAARADDAPMLPSLWDAPADAESTTHALVAPFFLDRDSPDGRRAMSCLTTAIYYEAATEDRDGQEAVAQVVLNRVRHAGFPKSVCGVVYQGVGTGAACQFSFACDGSLNRRPIASLWRSAEDVASAALSGHVAALAGASTHYHAAWASPYWRTSLVETGRIGSQIFYHLPGRFGSATALTAPYGGEEDASPPTPAMPLSPSASAARPRRTASVAFSPWGLTVATVSRNREAVKVEPTP